MRFEYLVYPSAIEKINKSGLGARVEKIKNSEDGLPYFGGNVMQSDIVNSVKCLTKEGFYNHFPADFAMHYKKTMNGILNSPKQHYWTIKGPKDKIKEPCDLEDLSLFSGDIASTILKPNEIWNYSKFGFSSPSGFVATIGAYLIQESHLELPSHEGYKWTRKREDGSEIVPEITGDMNADLRIFQTDIAPYPTIDPFGNEIEMRPQTKADRHIVAPYHSTEGTLFVAMMKYIEQQGIQTEYQKDNAKQLISWGKSFGQGGGSCAEHFGGFDHDARSFFAGYEYPLPQLNKNNVTGEFTNYGLITEGGEGAYGVYISHNGDFVLSYQDRDEKKGQAKHVGMRIPPEDAEHFIKGLIYQSAKGLGRTSAKQLLDIMAYRYSPQFEKDKKESDERIANMLNKK